MSGFKKYVVTWTTIHKKEVIATSKSRAELDVMLTSGESKTCIKSGNFKVTEK